MTGVTDFSQKGIKAAFDCAHRQQYDSDYEEVRAYLAYDIASKISAQDSELTALRNQVAELQTKLFAEQAFPKFRFKPYADTDAGLVAQVTELQNELANAHAEKTELQGKLDEIAQQKATQSGLDKSDIVASLACDPADEPK